MVFRLKLQAAVYQLLVVRFVLLPLLLTLTLNKPVAEPVNQFTLLRLYVPIFEFSFFTCKGRNPLASPLKWLSRRQRRTSSSRSGT